LASEYGWSKRDILENVYFDELVKLIKVIRKRKNEENKTWLALIQNPHTKKPEELWRILDSINKSPLDEKMDKQGLERLKMAMGGSKNIKVIN
jgi:hypothetical protein